MGECHLRIDRDCPRSLETAMQDNNIADVAVVDLATGIAACAIIHVIMKKAEHFAGS